MTVTSTRPAEWRPKEAVTFASWEMEKIELKLKPEALGSSLEQKSKMTDRTDGYIDR